VEEKEMETRHLKGLFSLIVIGLFVSVVPLSVVAGDEQNPEITDEEGDMFQHPYFYLPQRSLDAVDIVSAWFSEDFNESDFLFISLKVVDLHYLSVLRSTYLIEWGHGDYVYKGRFTTQFFGVYSVGILLRSYPSRIHFIRASFDKDHDLVTFKIPKKFIDDPQPGEMLTRTRVASTITTTSGYLLDFILVGDIAPDHQASGKDYVIQY
jgi:hypothetical protein